MKNSAMATDNTSDACSAAWRSALALFDGDLQRRGAAEKTRRAYGFDLGHFALWCTRQDIQPQAVTVRQLRRYAAVELGAEVLHEPRLWPEYHPGYYGAFVRDPDGNNVEAVCHTAADGD